MKTKRITGLLLALVLCLSLAVTAFAADAPEIPEGLRDYYDQYTQVGDFVYNSVKTLMEQNVELSESAEWLFIGLARSGYPIEDDVKEAFYQSVVKYVQENANDQEQLHRAKSTENSRTILALTALGYDVTDVGGHNLLMGLSDMEYIKKQGINGPIWALIALDSHDYEVPANPEAKDQASREKIVDYILDNQLASGGWNLSGLISDTDLTGMALQALAPYYEENKDVRRAADEAMEALSDMQFENGGFTSTMADSSGQQETSESTDQVLVALSALGIDAHMDQRFQKDGKSPLDDLMSYRVPGEGFKHIHEGKGDSMATEQGYYTLTAYFRMLNGQTSLYDMSDVEIGK